MLWPDQPLWFLLWLQDAPQQQASGNFEKKKKARFSPQVLKHTQHTQGHTARSWIERESTDLGFCFCWRWKWGAWCFTDSLVTGEFKTLRVGIKVLEGRSSITQALSSGGYWGLSKRGTSWVGWPFSSCLGGSSLLEIEVFEVDDLAIKSFNIRHLYYNQKS